MTTKEAYKKFGIKDKEIYELGKLGLSGITKDGRKWIIPDDTRVLISAMQIRRFLLQILMVKNNEGYLFQRDICVDLDKLKDLINQQYNNGFISGLAKGKSAEKVLKNAKLTDKGIAFVLGNQLSEQLIENKQININILNINNNIGLVNL